jgi:hypothetical protein
MAKEPIRKFFDDVQMAAESGGRQLDKNGKPLVGRYRDGSTPAPSKRAYGAGQMQIGTARNTAKARGIAWDEQKFLTDKNYNLTLADAHMEDLTKKYGDRTLARAAYHSGEPAVDRAIAKYGRDGFAAGLGPEGRKYIQMVSNGAGGAYNSSKPGQGVANPQAYLADLESKLAPEAKASGTVTQPAKAIFGSDAELGRRADAVEGNLQKQGAQLEVLDQTMEVAQTAAREAMTRQISETRDVSNEITEGTRALKEKVLPIFQARGRIADQLDKVNTMNPLERGLRGIFDMNYDDDYLEGQLDKYDRTLKARSDDFNYLNQLHGVALQEVERRYTLDTAMPALMHKQAEEDYGLVGMRITQTAGMLGALRDRISTESQVISAKAMAREDLMGRIDIPTVTDLMTKAQENGGMVQFNGVEFSYKELRDRLERDEQQNLQTEAYKMSIAGGRMDMATKYAENLARSLTRPQLEAAINNGGVYNGVQLPQDVLTNLYQGAISRDETRANVVAREMPAKLAMDTATNHLNQVTGLYQRGRGLFGNQAMEGSAPFTERAGSLVRRLTQAVQNGEPPEVVAALTQQIAQNSEQYTKFVDDRILQNVGGDKRAAGYLKGFVYGSQLSPGTAAEALTYFAMKGNLPEGVSLSPEAKQVFQKAQTLVQTHRGDRVNGKPISEQQLMGIVQRELTGAASQIMGQARSDKLWGDLPAVAKASGAPFGRFDGTRWAQIRSEAAMTGAEAIAKSLNTTPQNVLVMLRTGRPISNDEAGRQLLKQAQARAGEFNGVEMQTTIRLLDLEKQVTPGRRNSSVLTDFLGSPQFSNGISTYGRSLGSQSMGEYLVNPLVSGATERNFINIRDNALDAQARIHQSDRQLAQNPSTNIMLQPRKRTAMILQSIPGINKEGSDALAPFVSSFYDNFGRGEWPAMETPNSRFIREDNALLAALQKTTFPDKRLEQYRRIAVKGWAEHATAQQGFVTRMLDGIFGDEPSILDAERIPGMTAN